MTTPEHLVAELHRLSSDPARLGRGGEAELELRLDSRDYAPFEELYDTLTEGVANGQFKVVLEQSLNVIAGIVPSTAQHQRSPAQKIERREIMPDGERRVTCYEKLKVSRLARMSISPGVNFRGSLSIERPVGEVSHDGKPLYRFKNRLAFSLAAPDAGSLSALKDWRIDMTIVRELAGGEPVKRSLPKIFNEFFGLEAPPKGSAAGAKPRTRTTQDPETILASLGLRGSTLPTAQKDSNRRMYNYEIEIEYVGDPKVLTGSGITAAARALIKMVRPDSFTSAQMQAELARVAGHIMRSPGAIQRFQSGEWGLKQLTPQAIGLTRGQYSELFPPEGMYLTDKAHGIHALVVVRDGRFVLIAPGRARMSNADSDIAEAYFPSMTQPTIEAAVSVSDSKLTPAVRAAVQGDTVLDGELLMGEDSGKAGMLFPGRFMVFDVIMLKGAPIGPEPFEVRLAAMPSAIEAVSNFGAIDVQAKPFIRLGGGEAELRRSLEAMYRVGPTASARSQYDIDGLVFYQPGQSYAETDIRKWKPLEENTIDFLARRPSEKVLGRAPYQDRPGHKLYFLFVGTSYDMYQRLGMTLCPGYDDTFPSHCSGRRPRGDYFPVQFQTPDQPYAFLYQHPDTSPDDIEGRIIELRLRDVEEPAKAAAAKTAAAKSAAKVTPAAMAKLETTKKKTVSAKAKKAAISALLDGAEPSPAKPAAAVASAEPSALDDLLASKMMVDVGACFAELDSASLEPEGGTPGACGPDWELVRVRTDRDEDLRRGRLFGNNISTALMTWLNFRDPLTFNMLYEGPGGSYFQTTKHGIYETPTRFISYSKGELMAAEIAGSHYVVDLGSGKGQDMHRYRRNRVNNVVMVDRDRSALAEFTRRMIDRRKESRGADSRGQSTRFHVVDGSFTDPYEVLLARIRGMPDFPREGANAVVCNLAAHYAFGSQDSAANFAMLCSSLLRKGGKLILTLLNGKKIFDLLADRPEGASWDEREAGTLKYSIRRLYREKSMLPAGQRVGVLLPFSRGEYYEEYLSNVVELRKIFEKRGLRMHSFDHLTEKFGQGFASQRGRGAALTESDEKWLGLFVGVVFVKE